MVKQLLIVIALVAAAAASFYHQREEARNASYTDPLRYERMSWMGIKPDYLKEPLVAWEIISGPKIIELTGGGKVLTCMDEHLRLGDPFDVPAPTNIGEALDYCKAKSASK